MSINILISLISATIQSSICELLVDLTPLLLAALTAVYVILTYKILCEMKHQKEPKVYIECIIPELGYMFFIIANNGASPAIEIEIEVKKDVNCFRTGGVSESGLANLAPMINGVSYLIPGRQLFYRIGHLVVEKKGFPPGINTLLILELRYKNTTGKCFSNQIEIDMKSFLGIMLKSFREGWKD